MGGLQRIDWWLAAYFSSTFCREAEKPDLLVSG
jgi:hypothetical protein